MSNKSNAVDGERTKLSLEGKQKAALMALGEEHVRRVFRKALRKAVVAMRARDDKEKDETSRRQSRCFWEASCRACSPRPWG